VVALHEHVEALLQRSSGREVASGRPHGAVPRPSRHRQESPGASHRLRRDPVDQPRLGEVMSSPQASRRGKVTGTRKNYVATVTTEPPLIVDPLPHTAPRISSRFVMRRPGGIDAAHLEPSSRGLGRAPWRHSVNCSVDEPVVQARHGCLSEADDHSREARDSRSVANGVPEQRFDQIKGQGRPV
jgi:hypothetical protein